MYHNIQEENKLWS